MTVIVMVEDGNRVVLGSDSYIGDNSITDLCGPKVYRFGKLGLGFCGFLRPANIVSGTLSKLTKGRRSYPDSFVRETVPEKLRTALEDAGSLGADRGVSDVPDSSYVLACNGKGYLLGSDLGVYRSTRGYAAVGAGAVCALGALHVLSQLPISAEEKVRRAIEAAAELTPFVKLPVHIVVI